MKTKEIILCLIVALAILLVPNIVNAATSDVTLQSINVTSPAGTYKTGQVITIEAVFSGKVVGKTDDTPSITLKFGSSENYGNDTVRNGTIDGNKITYKYTITDTDGGPLSLERVNSGAIKDEQGNSINATAYSGKLSGNKIVANPIVWTDATKVKALINSEYALKVEGLTELKQHQYYVFYTNTATEPKIQLEEKYKTIINSDEFFRTSSNVADKLEKNGDIYYWICEEQINYDTGNREQKFIFSKKLQRPALHSLGGRMVCYFSNDSTSTFLYEAYDYKSKRNIKLKIGRITDTSILLAIKNKEANALSRLLAYSKSADSIYTGTVPLGKSSTITKNINIEDKAYYYVYMVLDDENGKYYPIEDVSLYQGLVGNTVGKNLYDFLDKSFTWNIEEKNYFSDFSESKAVLEKISVSTEDENKNELSFVVANVKINTEKKHQFYYYISNDTQDIPKYDSDLWKKADKVSIDAKSGTCYISTGNILKLPYIDKLNASANVYISIYEVIGDEEITSEKITGTYKLGLNAKKISLTSEEPTKPETPKDDDTVADTKIPQTGETVIVFTTIAILGVFAIITILKIRKYRDIK